MVTIKDEWKPFVRATIFLSIYAVIITAIFLSLTLGRGGEESSALDKVQTFGNFGITFGVILWVSAFTYSLRLRSPQNKTLQKLGFLGEIINNYDESLIGSTLKIKFFGKFLNQILIFLPIFFFIGYFGITQTGIEFFAEQQATESARIILAIEPAGSEIFIQNFLIMLVLFGFGMARKKYNWNAGTYWLFAIIFALIIGISYGYGIHTLRYSGSDADIFAVIIFWTVSALLQILFGSLFLAWILKDVNNLFQAIVKTIESSDTQLFIFWSIFFIIYSIILLVFLSRFIKKGK